MTSDNLPLGRQVKYSDQYDPSLLYPILRSSKRDELGVHDHHLPFVGFDVWNAYELSWLNNRGIPQVAIGRFIFDAASKYLIESKSLKLYLNSFNNTKFISWEQVKEVLTRDLSNASGYSANVELFSLNAGQNFAISSGICLDGLDIEFDIPQDVDSSHISVDGQNVGEKLYTHLFKSNCLVTNQPDWASIFIEYKGKKLEHRGLLKYLLSYRNHQGFHEHCVERIYFDLTKVAKFSYLSVFAKYSRRGGLDIMPYRASNLLQTPDLAREFRQ